MTVAVWASLGEIFRCFKDVGMVSCSNGDGNRVLDGIDEIQYKEIVSEFRFGQLRKSYLCKTAASHNR